MEFHVLRKTEMKQIVADYLKVPSSALGWVNDELRWVAGSDTLGGWPGVPKQASTDARIVALIPNWIFRMRQ